MYNISGKKKTRFNDLRENVCINFCMVISNLHSNLSSELIFKEQPSRYIQSDQLVLYIFRKMARHHGIITTASKLSTDCMKNV